MGPLHVLDEKAGYAMTLFVGRHAQLEERDLRRGEPIERVANDDPVEGGSQQCSFGCGVCIDRVRQLPNGLAMDVA